MKLNDFYADLKYSENKTEDQLINEFYYKVFPNLKEIKTITDITLQKKGIDKILTLKNGKEIAIDEKRRRVDYGDILLEEWSNFEKKKKGWTGDPEKVTDYIVYIIQSKIYIFPYDLLQLAWRKNYYQWREEYGIKEAQNPGYVTTNVPVPTDILFEAIKKEMLQDINEPATEEPVLKEDPSITLLIKLSSKLETMSEKIDYLFNKDKKQSKRKNRADNTINMFPEEEKIINLEDRKKSA